MTSLACYRLGGDDEPTLLLHGFLGSGKNLRSLAQRWAELEPQRMFLVPDLAGHGASPPLPENPTLDTMAADVLETADAAGLVGQPLTFAGHSLGGRIALAALRAAPARVAEVALLDISPGPIDDVHSPSREVLDVLVRAPDDAADRAEMRRHLLAAGLSPGTADWLLMNLRQEGGRYRWSFDRAALDRLHSRVGSEDLWHLVEGPAAREGKSRVRSVRGGRSRYVTDEDVQRLQAAGCEVHTLADAGHHVHVDALEPLVEWLA